MVFEKYEQVLRKETQRLLRIRKKRKRKFTRYMSWRWVKLSDNWRYPRGRDNKARLQLKGRPSLVKIGYRSPRLVRFLHPSGKYEILVRRMEDLYNVDP
ncbi:MAG: eL32 family ribosomal protein, partial [Candidatus Njordarchaeota archaeon]